MTARPLRVLTVTGNLAPGGTAGRILGMVKGLDRSRIHQRICLLYAPDPQLDEHFGTTRNLFDDSGIAIESLGMRHPKPGAILPLGRRLSHSLNMLCRATFRLAELARNERTDLIDAHMAPSSLIASVAGKLTRTPVVVTEYHIGEPSPVLFWPIVGRAALELADAVITDSKPRAEDLKTWMYRRKNKVSIIPNGIQPPEAARSREDVRAQFGIGEHDIVVAQISTLRPHKGHGVLLDAANLTLERVPHARFLIIGFLRGRDVDYRDTLNEQAKRLGIADRVFIGPYAGPIGDIWRACDVHAHATLFDSLPNAIIEGMSLGKPTVVTRVGGIPDLVTNEETGLMVEPNDPRALASALVRLIEDAALAKRLGANAYQRYYHRYRSEVTARKLEALFFDVAGAL